MSTGGNLNKAKSAKNDEFYTKLETVENEMNHYKDHFKGKVVYCNCDDPRVSAFFEYFSKNFEHLGLKKLVTSCYKNQKADMFSNHDQEKAIYLIYEGDKNKNRIVDDWEVEIKQLKGDGDFRSPEAIELLKEADIVVTNPPFSLFREYIAQLMEYDRKFLIIGSMNAIGYKETFQLIKENEIWLGINNGAKEYLKPDGTIQKMGNTGWFTNLEHEKRNAELILYKEYNEEDYPNYDNYDAIEVGKTKDIPDEYPGVMGVPISFLDKYNPNQFEIVGADFEYVEKGRFYVNGRRLYSRILIKHKQGA